MSEPTRTEIDAELFIEVRAYEPDGDRWAEYSGSTVRDAYLAGWRTGRESVLEQLDAQHAPRPGDYLAPTRGHHLAVCQDCDEPMVMPFGADAAARQAWTEGHSGALGHRVTWQQP